MDGTEGNLQELLRMGGHDVGGSGCPLATPVNKTKQTNKFQTAYYIVFRYDCIWD